MMMQQNEPDDYVIATGKTTPVRDFVRLAFAKIGIHLAFQGEGAEEVGVIDKIDATTFEQQVEMMPDHLSIGKTVVKVDPFYFRPTEVEILVGDASKAKEKLGWEPKYTLDQLIDEMVVGDLHLMKKEQYLKAGGFNITPQIEDVL